VSIISDTSTEPVVLALRPDVVATILDDGAVLLDLETKYFYALNPSAWSLVQLFESGASVADVERRAQTWGAPSDGSIRAFVEELLGHGLLETTGAESPGVEAVAQEAPPAWTPPTVERQAEPLQHVIVSAFDPSIPLAE
jgi:hypothetical protein